MSEFDFKKEALEATAEPEDIGQHLACIHLRETILEHAESHGKLHGLTPVSLQLIGRAVERSVDRNTKFKCLQNVHAKATNVSLIVTVSGFSAGFIEMVYTLTVGADGKMTLDFVNNSQEMEKHGREREREPIQTGSLSTNAARWRTSPDRDAGEGAYYFERGIGRSTQEWPCDIRGL